MLKKVFAILIALSATTIAEAEPGHSMTVADLKNFCDATDIGSQNACQFFIVGVYSSASLGALKATNHELYCAPDNTSASAVELMVKLRIAEDLVVFPKDRDLDAAGFVIGVLLVQFPCTKGK